MRQPLYIKKFSVTLRALCVSVVSFFVLQSCNVPDDGKNIPTSKLEALTSLGDEDSIKAGKEKNAKANGKLLLTAKGDNPGWYAEFWDGHLRLLINDGTDSLHLDHDFSDIATNKVYTKTIIDEKPDNEKTGSLSLVIQIETKPCTETGGAAKEKSISLRYNNQNFKGCATANIK